MPNSVYCNASMRLLIIAAAFISLLLGGCSMEPPKRVALPELAFPEPPATARFYFDRTIRSSADIIEATDEQYMLYALAGARISGVGFSKPFDISAHQGRIFISDPGAGKVLAFDLPSGNYAIIGKDKKTPISRPYGLDTDDAGNLYVVDGKQKRVFMYNRDGDFIKNIGNADQFSMISYLSVAPDGSRLYVVDTGGVESTKHEVVVFDTETGDRLSSFGKRGNGPGDLNLPKGITVAADGTLYVVDSGNFRVNHYNPDGTFISTFGSIGRQPGQFSRPKSVSTDKDGNVYVSDAAFGNFQIFNDQGQLLLWIGSRHQYGRRAEFFLPSGIDIDEDGRVLMTDQYHKKIDIFRPAGLEQTDGYMGLKKTEE